MRLDSVGCRRYVVIGALLSFSAPPAPASSSQPVPRTPDGHPDLTGFWTNATLTRFERPARFSGRATLTAEEAAAFERLSEPPNPEADFVEGGRKLAVVDGLARTSLIVDPPDGHIPARTAAARAHRNGLFPLFRNRPGLGNLSYQERCLAPFGAPPIIPSGGNSLFQIVQTSDAVMIMSEAIHDVRTIAMNAVSHPPANVRLWLGDSIGHWDGDVLVVETTNFKPDFLFLGNSVKMRTTEWFHRLDEATILYRATVDDPLTFVRPWTIEYPLRASTQAIYEFACHEGERDIPAMIAAHDRSPRAWVRRVGVRSGIFVPGRGFNRLRAVLFASIAAIALILLVLRRRVRLALRMLF